MEGKNKTITRVVAENVARLRKHKGWSQLILAEMSDLSVTTVAFFEAERIWPSLETIRKIVHALECDELDLFRTDKTPPTIHEALEVIAEAHGVTISYPKVARRPRPK